MSTDMKRTPKITAQELYYTACSLTARLATRGCKWCRNEAPHNQTSRAICFLCMVVQRGTERMEACQVPLSNRLAANLELYSSHELVPISPMTSHTRLARFSAL